MLNQLMEWIQIRSKIFGFTHLKMPEKMKGKVKSNEKIQIINLNL